MTIKSTIAVAAGRFGGLLSRSLRLGGGTSLPGAIALRIDPRIIADLARTLDRGSAVITATNGKTTTANMLAAIYHAAGLEPVHNVAGANLAFGVATALMSISGRDTAERKGIFEVDEAVLRNIAADLDPAVLTVGNIFRDQLDRFGEVDMTAKLIGQGIERLSPEARLVLNADDPRVASLAHGARQNVVFFGVHDGDGLPGSSTAAQDSKDCLICGEPLVYRKRYYSHLGVYACPGCGFSRPEPAVVASDISLSLRVAKFTLTVPSGRAEINLPVPALYNIYNALAAAATAEACGISLIAIKTGLEFFRPSFGRFETLEIAGRRVHLLLIKNPTGFNQAIEALNIDPASKHIMIAINDNLADGTDVSWLWDAELEKLGPTEFLLVEGTRAHDMALRMKYAGLAASEINIETDYDAALKRALSSVPEGGDLYILPTYTAMLDIRKRLEKQGGAAAFWRAGPDAPDPRARELAK